MSLVEPQRLELARALRFSQTSAEVVLWRALRDRRLLQLKFRRQRPEPPYVADFVCVELGLVIEIDGPSHLARTHEDAVRTEVLRRRGYRVIRFSNEDVLRNLDGVLRVIAMEARACCRW